MPKVSQAHLEARRQQILSAAARCFRKKGFHQATMQDIFREAKLSPGAVYNYFKSKDDIIVAIAEADQGSGYNRFGRKEVVVPRGEDALCSIYDAYLFPRLKDSHRMSYSALTLDVIAESTRNKRMAKAATEVINGIVEELGEIIKEQQQKGRINPKLDPRSIAWVLFSLQNGFVIQQIIDPGTSVECLVETFYALVRKG